MNKEGKYMLCANKNEMHLNYGIIFDDDTSYETIKNTVIQALEGKVAIATSINSSSDK